MFSSLIGIIRHLGFIDQFLDFHVQFFWIGCAKSRPRVCKCTPYRYAQKPHKSRLFGAYSLNYRQGQGGASLDCIKIRGKTDMLFQLCCKERTISAKMTFVHVDKRRGEAALFFLRTEPNGDRRAGERYTESALG